MRFSLCAIWKIISFFVLTLFFLGQDNALAASIESSDFSFEDERRKIIVAALDELSNSTVKQDDLQRKMAQDEAVEEIKKTPAQRQKAIEEVLQEQSRKLAQREKILLSKQIRPKKFMRWKMAGKWLNRFYYDAIENDPWEDVYSGHSWLSLENKLKFPQQDISVFVSSDIRYDLTGDDESDWDIDALLQEAYVQVKRDKWDFSLGRQCLTWGKLDDVLILDIINPQDYNEFVLLDKQQRKMPLFMAKLDYFWEENSIEGIFIPWFKPDRVRFFASDWALFGHLKEAIVGGNYPAGTKQLIKDIRIEGWDRDYSSLDDFEVAIKFSARKLKYDYAFYYMYLCDRIPQLRENTPIGRTLKAFLYEPDTPTLTDLVAANPTNADLKLIAEYNRMNIFGADFETTLGEFGLRGEMGIFLNRLYLKEDFSLVGKDTLSFGLGIDRTWANNLYCNLQFVEQIIFDGQGLFQTDEFGHSIVGTISKDFWRGNLVPSLDFAYNISYGDSLFNPELTYKFKGALELSVGGFILAGNSTTLFGRFDTNDVLYLKMERDF